MPQSLPDLTIRRALSQPTTSMPCWRPIPNAPSTPRWPTTALPDALEDYRRILSAGVNVVGSSAVFLQYPWQVIPEELLEADRGCRAGGQVQRVRQRHRPRIRQRPAAPCPCGHMPEHRSDPVHGDHQLRHLRQRRRDVRRDGLRQAARRDPDAAAARRARPRVGFGGAPARRGPRHLARRGERDLRSRTRARGLRHRIRSHREGQRRGAAVRGARHARRQAPPSSSSTSPGCATTCARTGRSRPRMAGPIASRSPANRPTRWTSASAAPTATTTTPDSSRRPHGSSTPSPPLWPLRRESGRRSTYP